MAGSLWPEEKTAKLRKMFANGASDPEMAEEFGTTTRAIIGKRKRLNLLRIKRDSGYGYAAAIRRAEQENRR